MANPIPEGSRESSRQQGTLPATPNEGGNWVAAIDRLTEGPYQKVLRTTLRFPKSVMILLF